ncbi:MAG: hypothetical protein OK455_11445 [Thaumarchaeota archaeon]|nr:hypothetical protein [Nitrososphaerota archaeon]
MPRGLGDNPLSRQKRNGSNNGKTAASELSSAPGTIVVNVPASQLDASAARYNDVFFQSRSDEVSIARSDVDVAEHDNETSTTSAPTSTMSAPVMEESAPSEPSKLALVVSSPVVSDDTQALQEVETKTKATVAASAAEETVTAPVESSPQIHNEVGAREGSGFFKRLFGRFQK